MYKETGGAIMKTIIRHHGEWYARECDETNRDECINCEAYDNCAFKPYNSVAITLYAICIILIVLGLVYWLG